MSELLIPEVWFKNQWENLLLPHKDRFIIMLWGFDVFHQRGVAEVQYKNLAKESVYMQTFGFRIALLGLETGIQFHLKELPNE